MNCKELVGFFYFFLLVSIFTIKWRGRDLMVRELGQYSKGIKFGSRSIQIVSHSKNNSWLLHTLTLQSVRKEWLRY